VERVTRITSSFGYRTDALDVVRDVDLRGKTALVTGGASGLGTETARALVDVGVVVVLPVRDVTRGAAARDDILSTHPHAVIEMARVDLGNLASIRTFGERFTRDHDALHILINNAAVMATPKDTTSDGFELQFGTNHVGHFALFQTLLPSLRAANGARVVALSSIGHRRSDVDFDDPMFERRDYDKWSSYGQSKTACSLFAVGVTARYRDDGIVANAVHPGGILTGLQKFLPIDEQRAMGWIDENGVVNERFKTVTQGAATSVWAAVGDELHNTGGLYLEDCSEALPFTSDAPFSGYMDYAVDPDRAERLWALTTALVP
jgi:NAD(P)-dependent dehydrogenase (short-subunit alcohol dehydrogenase family)